MRDDEPSRLSIAMTWAAIAITVVPVVFGLVRYGVSWELRQQFWADLFKRPGVCGLQEAEAHAEAQRALPVV